MSKRGRRFMLIAALCMTSVAASAGCSVPKVIVLHDPLTAEEHDRLGRIYESRGELQLAANQYREAIKKDNRRLASFLLLGDLAFRTKQYDEAQAAYEKALQLDRRSGDLRNSLACVYLATGKKLPQAEQLLKEAIVLNRASRAYYLDTLGLVLLKQGDTKRAVLALRESVTLAEEKPEFQLEALAHLAEAYKSAGDDENYQQALQRHVELQREIVSSPSFTYADNGGVKANLPADAKKSQNGPSGP